jgi:hypothetical protein
VTLENQTALFYSEPKETRKWIQDSRYDTYNSPGQGEITWVNKTTVDNRLQEREIIGDGQAGADQKVDNMNFYGPEEYVNTGSNQNPRFTISEGGKTKVIDTRLSFEDVRDFTGWVLNENGIIPKAQGNVFNDFNHIATRIKGNLNEIYPDSNSMNSYLNAARIARMSIEGDAVMPAQLEDDAIIQWVKEMGDAYKESDSYPGAQGQG